MAKQGKKLFLILVALAVSVLGSCSPAPVPPSPGVPKPSDTPAGSRSGQGPVTTQDDAWAKTVAAAKKEGTLTFYSVTYVGSDAIAMRDLFFKKYGINMDIIGGRGSSNFERLKTEKRMGQMVGDIVQANTVHLLNMKRDGILERIADLPEVLNKDQWEVDPFSNDPDGYVAASQAQWLTPLVNPRLVPKDKEPKSLQDLLKPEWKGKIVFMSPIVSSGAYNYYAPFVNHGLIDWSYIEKLGQQNLGWSQGTADTPLLVAKGDYPIAAFSWSGQNAQVLLEGGAIKALSMSEGDPYSLSALAVVKGSPHPNAARLFMNWVLSREGTTALIEKTNYKIDSLLKNVPSGTPEALVPPLKKRIVVSNKDMDDAAKLYDEQNITKLLKLKK